MAAPSPQTLALILAAGKGTRMRSAQPKVMLDLGGAPMLAHVLAAAGAVADGVRVIHGPEMPSVMALAEAAGASLACQHSQRGTGDAVRAALPLPEGTERVLVLSGDVPLLEAAALEAFLAAVPVDAVGVMTTTLADPTGFGRMLRDDAGAIVGIVEEKDATEAQRAVQEINAGVYCFPAGPLPRWLDALTADNAQGELYLTDLIALARADGVPCLAQHEADADSLRGANTRAQLADLEATLQHRRRAALMAAGVTLRAPETVMIRGSLQAGQDCIIDAGCVFEGKVILGENVKVGAHCVIKNAELQDGAQVAPLTHIEGAVVGPEAQLGPFARLREGTVLGRGTRIGNFVETKKATLGDYSKANHLAYLGDATLGERVNVGAGTITCNYDGIGKHPTVLGNDVFVGSNSTLVAPLTVGDGAFLGAGSTITKDVDAETLAVGRGRQRSIAGWQSPKARAQQIKDED